MAKVKKTNAQYKADSYARKKARMEALGERDVTLPVPLTTWRMIEDLQAWHGFTDWRELVLNMVRVAHSHGRDGKVLTTIPPSGFKATPAQLAKVGKPCNTCGGTGEVLDENEDTIDCPTCNKETLK